MAIDLKKKLCSMATQLGTRYTFKGRSLGYDEVFSAAGLLPGLAKRADQLSALCFGYGIGVTFDDTEESLLGSRVNFDTQTPDSLRLLCIADVLFELIKSAPMGDEVSLDELMYD